MSLPITPATGPKVPAEYTEIDAILHHETKETLAHHFQRGLSLRDIGEALVDSYNGSPDMIAVMISWMNKRSLDGTAMLRTATENAMKARGTEIVNKLDNFLLSSARPPPVFLAAMNNPYWRRVFSTLTSDHKTSALRYWLDRQQQLSAIGLSYDMYESPRLLSQTIKNMMESEISGAGSSLPTNESLNTLYDKIATVATEDENSCLVVLRELHEVANNADSKQTRGIAHAASSRVCAAFSEKLSQVSGLSKYEGRYFAIRLRLAAAIRDGESVPCENTLKSIYSLMAPVDPTSPLQAERRRIDKAVGNVRSIYRRLLNKHDIENHPYDVDAVGEDDMVIEAVSESLDSVSVRFALMRILSYPDVREDLARTAFTQWRDFSTGGPVSGPVTASLRGESTDSRRRNCVCLMLAHAEIAVMLSDRQLRGMLSNAQGTEGLRNQVRRAEQILRVSAEACMTARTEIERGDLKRLTLRNLLRTTGNKTVAWGIILWANEGFTGGQRDAHPGSGLKVISPNASRHAALLEAVIREHAEFTHDAIAVLQRAAFRGARKGEPESVLRSQRHVLLKILASWVKLDSGSIILEAFLKDWAPAKKLTNEDLRIFIDDVLQIVAPPFSPSFSVLLKAVLRHDRIVQAVAEDNKLSSLVLAFQSSVYKV